MYFKRHVLSVNRKLIAQQEKCAGDKKGSEAERQIFEVLLFSYMVCFSKGIFYVNCESSKKYFFYRY